jgi:DNA-binding transcriptional ArsR family regulator
LSEPTDLVRAFAALSDPTRAAIIEWLGEGGTGTATTFAARLPISRQAVTRHLKELEEAGLIVGTRRGREVRYTLEPSRLSEMAGWLEARAARWERTLQRLADHLERS